MVTAEARIATDRPSRIAGPAGAATTKTRSLTTEEPGHGRHDQEAAPDRPAQLPPHQRGAEPGDELVRQRPRWKTVVVIAIVVLLVAAFIILHVTGVVGAKTNM